LTVTPDTSVVVAGLGSWDPDHIAARRVLAQRPPLVAHVLVESYAVLTRLPHPRRLAPELVLAALSAAFPDDPVQLEPTALRPLLARLGAHAVAGGRTYDALVAETARQHDLTLVTLDWRAKATYDLVGVETAMLA